MIYVFDDFELDMPRGELRRAGQILKLERQVFRVLAYLVQHHGQTVSKQQLIEHAWTQAGASDWALARCIKLARKILGESGRRQRIIQTLYGDGYCFAASVEERCETTPGAGQMPPSSRPHSQQQVPEQNAIAPHTRPLSPSQKNPLPGTTVPGSWLDTQVSAVAQQVQSAAGALVLPTAIPRQALWHGMEEQCQRVTVLCGVLTSPGDGTGHPDPGSTPDVVQEFFTCVLREVQRYEGIVHHFTDRGFTAVFGAVPSGGEHPWRALLAACKYSVNPYMSLYIQ